MSDICFEETDPTKNRIQIRNRKKQTFENLELGEQDKHQLFKRDGSSNNNKMNKEQDEQEQ